MERVLDQQGRWRNKVVAFRMSPEEDEVLEAKVKLSGLTKQEYIIRRLTDREITVVGNPRFYIALRDQMKLQERVTLLSAAENERIHQRKSAGITMLSRSRCRACSRSASVAAVLYWVKRSWQIIASSFRESSRRMASSADGLL